ncbi:MAG TPA: tetratricopeptide repeat protein, partial [Gammaproteobacteria bacterium]|nr:tetratricopeptide repeat protein [Gammaproteobacteria bacterium]
MDRPQLELAERMFRRAIELDPNYAPAHHWLSLALLSRGAPDESLAQAEQAVELDPLSASINFNLGFTRERLNRFEDAVRAYQKTIEIDPVMPGPYSGIGGVAAYGFGRLDQAIPWYEKAADLDPGNPAAPSHLVLLQLTLGNTEEAGRWLDRALEFGEQSADPNLAAALFYLDRGNEREARRYAQIAAAMEPSAIFLLRDDDFRDGDYASARARYAAAFPELLAGERPTIDASNAGVAIELALVLQRTGEPERAKRLLDRSEAYYRTTPRMGQFGYGVADVAIHALRGEKAQALAGLRRAEKAGWCGP